MPALAWVIDCINPRSRGLVFAIDGRERWLVHSFLKPGESPSAVDRQRGIREILGVESEFVFDSLGREDWTASEGQPECGC
jgi:hypothetical protein